MRASRKPSPLSCGSGVTSILRTHWQERLTWRPQGHGALACHEVSTSMLHSLDTAGCRPVRPDRRRSHLSGRSSSPGGPVDVLPRRAGQVRCGFIVILLSTSSWFALARLRSLRPAPGRVIGCPALAAGGHRCGRRPRFQRAPRRSAHSLAATAKVVAQRSPGRSAQPAARGALLDSRSHPAVKGALRSTLCPGPRSPGGRS
jgi:hypothetical protein